MDSKHQKFKQEERTALMEEYLKQNIIFQTWLTNHPDFQEFFKLKSARDYALDRWTKSR